MNLTNECKICLYNQIERFLKNENKYILEDISKKIEKITTDIPPPKAAIEIYKTLNESLKCNDPYNKIKQDSIKLAKTISKNIKINNLYEAIKASVIGNAIDYGSQSSDDIQSAIQKTINEEFVINDIDKFKDLLSNARTMLFIADNAGENYFDEILIRFIKENYNIKITYIVRGNAIINDLTMQDIQEHKSLYQLCDIKSSGIPSPGFIYDLANDETKKHFDNDDMILAKGMGNFECLESTKDKRLFLLFKIKCSVVSSFLKQQKNKLVFKNNSL